MQTAFQILNYHKNIVIEVSNFIIGDQIICDKLKYPKHYGKKIKYMKKMNYLIKFAIKIR